MYGNGLFGGGLCSPSVFLALYVITTVIFFYTTVFMHACIFMQVLYQNSGNYIYQHFHVELKFIIP